jgi:hypothetical protein
MMRIGKPYGIRETGHDTRTNERDSNIPNTIRRNLFTVWRSCNVTLIPGPGLPGISFRMLSALPSQP